VDKTLVKSITSPQYACGKENLNSIYQQ